MSNQINAVQTGSNTQGLDLLASSVTLNPVMKSGQILFTAEDLGKALGYSNPKESVSKIFQRNRKELKHYSVEVSLTSTDGKSYIKRAFTREGALIISMLAKTNRAKAVRAWLAQLGVEKIEEVRQQAILEAKRELAAELLAARPLWKKIKRYKELGLNNHEVCLLLECKPRTLLRHLRRMENAGIVERSPDYEQRSRRARLNFGLISADKEGSHA